MQTGLDNPVPGTPQSNTSPQRSGPNRGLIIGLVAGVIVIALIALSAVHYTGPTRTIQSFVNNYFTRFNASDAYNQLCSDTQAEVTKDQLQTTINTLKSAGASYDISGITYKLVDENFFGDAHVSLGGSVSVTIDGHKQTIPITGTDNTVTLHSTGLGWCIESNPISSS